LQIANYTAAENVLPADQRGVVEGGNPALQPEKSFGFNIGTVITPTFLPGFSIGGDYYETTVKNAIQSSGGVPLAVGVDAFVTACYVQQIAGYCSAISRNAQGIFQINAQNINFGGNHVEGMELEASYDTAAAGVDLPFIPGSLVVDTTLTREFTNFVLVPPVFGGDIHQTGTYNAGTEFNYPSYRSMLNLDWTDEDISVHWDTRYQSGTRNIAGGSGYGSTLPDYFVHSLSVSYNLNGWFGDNTVLKSSRIIFGINNLFDKDPPFVNTDGNCKCNTYVGGAYDEAGRSFFLRLTEKM
jgi:outer membrane receptor for ferrienterochelin and colicin